MQPILPTAMMKPIKPAINSQGLPLTATRMPAPRRTPIPIQTTIAQSNFMGKMLTAFACVTTADSAAHGRGAYSDIPTVAAFQAASERVAFQLGLSLSQQPLACFENRWRGRPARPARPGRRPADRNCGEQRCEKDVLIGSGCRS